LRPLMTAPSLAQAGLVQRKPRTDSLALVQL